MKPSSLHCALALLLSLHASLCSAQSTSLKRNTDAAFSNVDRLHYRVIRSLPHAPESFTEGLEMLDGKLLESSGLYGRSALILREIEHPEPLRDYRLPAELFGEGITVFDRRIYQLSWREQLAMVYDESFKPLRVFRYQGEGWGLAHDDTQLIMSDGSARLYFRDPDDFSITRVLDVHADGRQVTRLNELEYAHGLIFANVWQTDDVLLIDPISGEVRGRLDLSPLRQQVQPRGGWQSADDVLNGIAWDAQRDVFYVTGKRWPRLFELRLESPLPAPHPSPSSSRK